MYTCVAENGGSSCSTQVRNVGDLVSVDVLGGRGVGSELERKRDVARGAGPVVVLLGIVLLSIMHSRS